MSRHLTWSCGRVIVSSLAILAPMLVSAEPAKLANITQVSSSVILSPANVSLDNGQIAFVGLTPMGYRDVYFFDGASVSMLTNDAEAEEGVRLSDGRIVWNATLPGTLPQDFAIFFHESGVTRQISGAGAFRADIDGDRIVWTEPTGVYLYDLSTNQQRQIFAGERIFRGPSLHQNQVAWIFHATLYHYDIVTDTLTPISMDVDLNSEPSLHSGQIAWNRGQTIFLWDGANIVEIPTGGGVYPGEISLFEGRMAWSAFDPIDFTSELYYFDGETTSRLTDISPGTFVKLPSLDGSQLAFAQSGAGQGLFLADIVTVTGQSATLIEEIQNLVDAGILNQGQGNALITKVESALASFDKGNLAAARNKIEAFINQVEAYVSAGILTASEGQVLIDAANVILALFD